MDMENKIRLKKNQINSALGFVIMKEADTFVGYCPALDMSTQGGTFEQLKKRMAELVDIFFEETIKNGTLSEALNELGWQRIKQPHRRPRWVPPQLIGQVYQDFRIPA
jgi:predicted RNase H-like HicB family nuclease